MSENYYELILSFDKTIDNLDETNKITFKFMIIRFSNIEINAGISYI